MTKFKRVLSGYDYLKLHKKYDGSVFNTIYDVEQAVLAKLAEQEPETYIILDKEGFEIDLVPSTKDYELKDGETFIPLYARPMPCVAPVSDKPACDSQNEKYETQIPNGTLTDEGTKNHDVESSNITLEYRQFAEWCRANPSFDLNSRLHSHSGTIDNGGYISDEKTRIAFSSWRAARKSLAAAPKYGDS